jgi:hypothetical protein
MILDTISKREKGYDKRILFLLLFNIVADMLAIMINRAKDDG